MAELTSMARALAARSSTFSAAVYLRGSSSEVSLRRFSKSAMPPVSVFSSFCDSVFSSSSVRDARGHKISAPQTRARPATISEIPRARMLPLASCNVKGRGVPALACVRWGGLLGRWAESGMVTYLPYSQRSNLAVCSYPA